MTKGGREKNPDHAPGEARSSTPAPVTPGRPRMPWRVRFGQFVIRLKIARQQFARWWRNPAPAPDEVGKQGARAFDKRPAALELGFYLHADGKVYLRDRNGGGDIRVQVREIEDMVRREYRILFEQHKRRFERRGKVLRKLRALTSRRKDVDTTEPESAS